MENLLSPVACSSISTVLLPKGTWRRRSLKRISGVGDDKGVLRNTRRDEKLSVMEMRLGNSDWNVSVTGIELKDPACVASQ